MPTGHAQTWHPHSARLPGVISETGVRRWVRRQQFTPVVVAALVVALTAEESGDLTLTEWDQPVEAEVPAKAEIFVPPSD